MRKYLCNLRTYYVNFRATSLKYCYLHVLNFYLDNGVMTTPKRRFLSFAFTVLSFKKSLLIRILSLSLLLLLLTSLLNFPSSAASLEQFFFALVQRALSPFNSLGRRPVHRILIKLRRKFCLSCALIIQDSMD